MTVLAEVLLGADPEAWRACGFTVSGDGTCTIGLVRVRFVDGPAGLRSLGIAGGPEPLPDDVDGVALHLVTDAADEAGVHRNGAVSVDHVVVFTPDLERTIDAVVDGLGAPLKRIREAGPVRQAFFRLGAPILEVVAVPDAPGTALWGLVASVADLDAAVAVAGPERIGEPKDAVQPGRRIATVRAEAGLGTAVALMSAHVRP